MHNEIIQQLQNNHHCTTNELAEFSQDVLYFRAAIKSEVKIVSQPGTYIKSSLSIYCQEEKHFYSQAC
jgi:hypothetical protein